jgi:hypothetical protein
VASLTIEPKLRPPVNELDAPTGVQLLKTDGAELGAGAPWRSEDLCHRCRR